VLLPLSALFRLCLAERRFCGFVLVPTQTTRRQGVVAQPLRLVVRPRPWLAQPGAYGEERHSSHGVAMVKLIDISGSLRRASFNTALLRAATELTQCNDGQHRDQWS
jgi:hypothetical protein